MEEWRSMSPISLIEEVAKRQPSLSANTLKTYKTQLSAFLKMYHRKTLGGVLALSNDTIKQGLESDPAPMNTKASRLNAFVSVLKHLEIPMGEVRRNVFIQLNDQYREAKMKPMEEGQVKSIPGFGEIARIKKLIEAWTTGAEATPVEQRSGTIMGMLLYAPTVRTGQLEDVYIARTADQYEAFKKQDKSALAVYGDAFRLWTNKAHRKVKTIDTEVVYSGKAKEIIDRWVSNDQEKLFDVKTQGIERDVKRLTKEAKVFNSDGNPIGVHEIRRFMEAINQNDPTRSYADKEAFSKQMNHGKDMGEKYRPIREADEEAGEADEADETHTAIGEVLARIGTALIKKYDQAFKEDILLSLHDIYEKMESYKPPNESQNKIKVPREFY